MKLVVNADDDKILGVHMVGDAAGEGDGDEADGDGDEACNRGGAEAAEAGADDGPHPCCRLFTARDAIVTSNAMYRQILGPRKNQPWSG